MFTDRLFSSSPAITSLRWRSINPSRSFFLSRALEGLRRENRGSVNRLGEFMSSTKRKIEHFHAIVAQQRQKIYVKKCAAVFCRSRCRRRRLCLNPVTTAREEGNTQSIGLWRNTLFKNWTEYWVSEFFTFCFLYITALLQQHPLRWACVRSDPFKGSFAHPLSGSFSRVNLVFDVEYHVQYVLPEYFKHVLHMRDAKAFLTM